MVEKDIKAIIFDMDGVIVDTEMWYQDRRRKFVESLGYHLQIDWQEFIGETFASLWPKICNDIEMPLEEVESRYQQYKKNHPIEYETLLIPGMKPIVKLLKEKGYLLAVASSSTLTDIKKCLTIHDLADDFAFVNSARDLGHPKPSPLVYQKTLQDLQLDPQEVIVIEDSAAGISAAKQANLKVIAYHNPKYQLDQSQADYQIVQHAQIITILETEMKKRKK